MARRHLAGQGSDPTATGYDQWARADEDESQPAILTIRDSPSRRGRRASIPPTVRRGWERALAVVNALRLAAGAAVVRQDRRQAREDGAVLAPAGAFRKIRGAQEYRLSRHWRHAAGIIHHPAWVLLTLDAHCGRLVAGTAAPDDPGVPHLADLMRSARIPGAPVRARASRAFREWAVHMTGACLGQIQISTLGLKGVWWPCPGAKRKIASYEQHIVDTLAHLWPQWAQRLRRCDVETCYRYFFDASPTANARGCAIPGHDVQLARVAPRQYAPHRPGRRKRGSPPRRPGPRPRRRPRRSAAK